MAFACPECGAVSHHPIDEKVGWCGRCERFTRDSREATELIVHQLLSEGQFELAAAVSRRLHPSRRR